MNLGDFITNLSVSYLELTGFIAAVIYLLFSIRQKIWLWPLGIITSLAYIFIFYQQKIYGYAALNGYYVIISVYGWYIWHRNAKISDHHESLDLPVKAKALSWILLAGMLLWFVFYVILSHFTDSAIPIGDSFTTAFSVVATWMLARKYLENWLFWIVIDSMAAALYWYQNMVLTAILYLIYTIMAVIGYYQWYQSMHKLTAGS